MNEDLKYRFFVTTQAGEREMFPINTNNLNITWAKDPNAAFFRKNLTGKVKFVEDDFSYLYAQERSIYRCTFMPFRIEKNCAGFSEWFIGRLLCDDGTWDLDHFEVEIQANVVDNYACYDDNKGTIYNLFGLAAHDEHVNTLRGTIETVIYTDTGYPPVDWKGSGDPFEQGWEIFHKIYQQDPTGSPPTVNQSVTWIRELYTSDHPLGDPWILLSTDTSNPLITFYHYARPPALFDQSIVTTKISDTTYQTETSWKYGAKWQNGFKLYDILSAFLTTICIGTNLKSDFFQWNPDNVSTVNYATGEDSKVLNLILFQKSDVKRPPSESDIINGFAPDDAATIANTSFDDLITDILTTFKLQFWIDDDNNFRIEHPSYFNKVLGLDLTDTTRDDIKFRLGLSVYNYVTDGLPKREIFTWMDTASSGDFAGQDIVYQSTCSGISDQNNKNITVKNITTDVQLCLDNPDESSDVSDDGFSLMACDEDNNLLYQTSILGGHVLNNTLAWAELQYDYFRYNNYFEQFTLNNNLEDTLKLLPNKKQTSIICVMCCGEDFDADKLVKSVIGTGIVNSATLNLYTDQLTLELLFEQNQDLTSNNPPVAVNGNERTPKNTVIIIDVLTRASDSDGTIVDSTLVITSAPIHGTAIVTGDFKIQYTPDAGFVGVDHIGWEVQDDFSQLSNQAIETITIYQPAVASDDVYRIAENKVLNGEGLMNNDLGTLPIQTVAESKATENGHVVINTDGTFTYTPNANYIGDDHFQYTLKDVNNDTDLGTVTITVFETVHVYIKLVKGNGVNNDVTQICSGGPQVTGNQIDNDFTLFFYSDMAGTIPLDTTGYEDLIKYNYYNTLNGVRTDSVGQVEMSGTSIFLGNFATSYNDNGCDHTLSHFRTFDITGLVASPDYTEI